MKQIQSGAIIEKDGKLFRNNIEVKQHKCLNKSCTNIVFRQKYGKFNKKKVFCSNECEESVKDPKSSTILLQKNTPNLCYLIGLIAADGNLQKESKGVSVCLKWGDTSSRRLLKKLKKLYGGRIEIYKDGCGYWKIHVKQFSDYLKSIGFTHHKTFTLDVSSWFLTLNDQLKWCFLRGCWDGDGSFIFLKNKTWYIYRAQFGTASKKLFEMLTNFLGKQNVITRIEKSSFFKIKVHTGKKIIDIFQNMYNITANDLFLERKYKNFLKIKKYVNKG